jgi:hypothetical protein
VPIVRGFCSPPEHGCDEKSRQISGSASGTRSEVSSWTKSARDILQKVIRANSRLS